MSAKLKKIRQELRRRLHDRTANMVEWLVSVVRGYFQYHAVPCNEERLKTFRCEVQRMWLWQRRRRSQRTRWTWTTFLEKLGNLLPEVEILHPYPNVRFSNASSESTRESGDRRFCHVTLLRPSGQVDFVIRHRSGRSLAAKIRVLGNRPCCCSFGHFGVV
jgi:hypothetical protein